MAGYRDTLNLPRTDVPDEGRPAAPRARAAARGGGSAASTRKLRDARARGGRCGCCTTARPTRTATSTWAPRRTRSGRTPSVRVASLLGFDSPYVPGWDNHGMPIEIQVEQGVPRAQGRAARPPDAAHAAAASTPRSGSAIQRERVRAARRLGRLGAPLPDDGPRASRRRSSRRSPALAGAGFVQRGLRSIHWCPTDRTALAEAEIEYQDDPSPSILVAFPLRKDRDGRARGPRRRVAPWRGPRRRGRCPRTSA